MNRQEPQVLKVVQDSTLIRLSNHGKKLEGFLGAIQVLDLLFLNFLPRKYVKLGIYKNNPLIRQFLDNFFFLADRTTQDRASKKNRISF